MNIALTCDHLLSDDHFTRSLACLLEHFPHAPIYTVAHKRGRVPVVLQERTIHSSGLSRKVGNTDQLASSAWLVPQASKHLFIPCSTDIIFSFSAGLGHGIKKCKKTRQITYLYKKHTPGSGLKQKFFASYLETWSRKKLAQSDHLWVATPGLLELCRPLHPNPVLINPGFKVECFLRPSPLSQATFHAVEGPVTPELSQIFKKCDCSWKALASSEILKNSHALISPHPNTGFPQHALESLALGNPVIIRETPLNREILGPLENNGVIFINDIRQIPSALEQCPFPVSPGPLRSLALQYSQSRFKSTVGKMLKQIINP